MPPNFWDVWADLAAAFHWSPTVLQDLTGWELRKWHYHLDKLQREREQR